MQQRSIEHSDVWSNILFLIPISVALYFGLFYFSIFLALGTIISFLYHYSGEKKLHSMDKILSGIAIAWSFVLVYRGGFEPRSFLYALIVFVALAVYFFSSDEDGKNEMRHSFWHFFISFIAVFCILIFVF